MTQLRRSAWILILLADAGLFAWGAMAALAPDHLLGPDSTPILMAGYERYTGASWATLASTSPMTRAFITVLFRLYGAFNVAVGLLAMAISANAFRRGERWAWWALLVGNTIAYIAAMTYDRIVNAIGPFEMLEYVGIASVYAALAVTAPAMLRRALAKTAVAAAALALFGSTALAQRTHNVKLHVDPGWSQCSFQLDASLTQAAWHQFTAEAGVVTYFRPLVDAEPMGAGSFEVSLLQWQTSIDDTDAAWNDTFVHPDSTHWLIEGSGLAFPGATVRAGLSARTDVGAYFTKSLGANYGFYGAQLQQNLLHDSAKNWSAAARVSFVSMYGPADLDFSVYGLDLVASRKYPVWSGRALISPYVALATSVSRSHEKSSAVNLADDSVWGAMATVGFAAQLSAARIAVELGAARVPSLSFKLGVGRS
jgi:hypothetical protein